MFFRRLAAFEIIIVEELGEVAVFILIPPLQNRPNGSGFEKLKR